MKLVECVPNFSEGRNKRIIDEIVNEISSIEGIEILDISMGYETNRTVITFIGTPERVKEAAFLGIKKAVELIDMRKHKGAHPRIGAADVVPFIPLKNVSFEECIEIAKEVAKRVGEELRIPVYLYGKAATKPERENLANIREGEYEGLKEKLKSPEWKPDYGPSEFNPKSGATIIGVRDFLIAYNINLNTRETKYATDIAFELREKGRSVRKGNIKPFYYKGEIVRYKEDYFPCGNCDFIGKTIDETVKHCKEKHGYDLKELLKMHNIDPENPIGKPVKKPGKFKECKAIGWKIPEYDRVQISINLTNYKITNVHHVYEEAKKLADERGLTVTGSEIVGLIPYEAILEAGKYYLKKQGKSLGIPLKDILETAVQSLGLRDVSSFEIEKKVIGLPEIFKAELLNKKLIDFVDEISRESPSPGGGSVSALCASLASSLSLMVLNLSFDRIKNKRVKEKFYEISDKLRELKEFALLGIEKDKEAFEKYLKALKEKRDKKEALIEAIDVPLSIMEKSVEIVKISEFVLKYGMKSALSDIGCSFLNLYSSFYGAYMNVLINLKNLEGEEKEKILEKTKKMEKEFLKIFRRNIKKIFKELS
ncbi:MAG: glutamate formimidoyltransferase [candidate division WOR-3 bacterium]